MRSILGGVSVDSNPTILIHLENPASCSMQAGPSNPALPSPPCLSIDPAAQASVGVSVDFDAAACASPSIPPPRPCFAPGCVHYVPALSSLGQCPVATAPDAVPLSRQRPFVRSCVPPHPHGGTCVPLRLACRRTLVSLPDACRMTRLFPICCRVALQSQSTVSRAPSLPTQVSLSLSRTAVFRFPQALDGRTASARAFFASLQPQSTLSARARKTESSSSAAPRALPSPWRN